MIPSLFGEPDTESLRIATARCLYLIQREHGVTAGEIAHAAGCSTETIRKALRREADLGLLFWSKIKYWFRESPGCFEPYEQLWNPDFVGVGPQSPEERLNVIQRELEEVRKAVRRKETA